MSVVGANQVEGLMGLWERTGAGRRTPRSIHSTGHACCQQLKFTADVGRRPFMVLTLTAGLDASTVYGRVATLGQRYCISASEIFEKDANRCVGTM